MSWKVFQKKQKCDFHNISFMTRLHKRSINLRKKRGWKSNQRKKVMQLTFMTIQVNKQPNKK